MSNAFHILKNALNKKYIDWYFFMPGNDVDDILCSPHTLYLVIYFAFLTLYFNSFYLIPMLKNYIKNKKQNKTPLKVS